MAYQPQIVSTQDASLRHGVKVMVYAASGLGKTVLCSTLPAPIILSAESGLLSLRNYNLPVIQVRTVEDLTNIHQWLLHSHEAKQFKSVAIDSITEVGEVVLANAKLGVKDPRQAYGELIEKMLMTIKAYRDLPERHVYMAAKEEAVKDELTGITQLGASMPGSKLGPQLPYLFDFVFRLAKQRAQDGSEFRYLQTQPTIQSTAKDRAGIFEPMIEPHLGKMIDRCYQINNGA